MKAQFSIPIRFLFVLCLCVSAIVPAASAQSRPSLDIQFFGGQPSLTITGMAGTVYSIQYATGLSPTNNWTVRTLVQVQGATASWNDPDVPTPGQRFYRAAFVPAPTDTNLVFIQPGTFTMGSPTNETDRGIDETQHIVTISRGFWMVKYLVTQGDYLAVVGNNPSYFNGIRPTYDPSCACVTNLDYGTDPSRPVETVSWYDATNYCALRTARERAAGLIPTNYVYRLPTESEWEYAARAGTTTAFYIGCGLTSGQANFDGKYEYYCGFGTIGNPSGIYLGMTTLVGSYLANPWGLYDMIGNVEEWCQDWYGAYPSSPVTDPQGPAGSHRVIRGGYWIGYAFYCRSAMRLYYAPGDTYDFIGFRAVLAPDQP